MLNNHFRAYNEIRDKIRYKEIELMKLKEDYYNITGVRLDDIKIKGGKPIDIADKLHVIVEKEKELVGLRNYKEELKRMHEKEINELNNSKERMVLKLFYLDGCTIKEIACNLEITEGHTKKLKRWGIRKLIEQGK